MRNTTGLTPGSAGRRAGKANAQPTPRQIDSYRRELHTRAQGGDTLALGFIVLFDHLRQQNAGEAR